ncbi:hypothetical protein AAY473_011295 [Plecturocebus cupreus]
MGPGWPRERCRRGPHSPHPRFPPRRGDQRRAHTQRLLKAPREALDGIRDFASRNLATSLNPPLAHHPGLLAHLSARNAKEKFPGFFAEGVVVLAATPISEVKGEGCTDPKRLSWPGHKADGAEEWGFVSLTAWHFGRGIYETHTWRAQRQVGIAKARAPGERGTSSLTGKGSFSARKATFPPDAIRPPGRRGSVSRVGERPRGRRKGSMERGSSSS